MPEEKNEIKSKAEKAENERKVNLKKRNHNFKKTTEFVQLYNCHLLVCIKRNSLVLVLP